MSADQPTPPRRAPEALDDQCLDLLTEPLAAVCPRDAERPALLRERVLDRIGRSAQASRAFVTVRARRGGGDAVAEGVMARTLYRRADTTPRAGEPARVRIVDLAAGACWRADLLPGFASEWLVMDGTVVIDGSALQARDFQRRPPGMAGPELRTPAGARLYVRESPVATAADDGVSTVIDAVTPWDDFAPGIRRRVLWTDGREAALLYLAEAGAQVPHHGHSHDEECLMLDGEVFLDDLLLCRGDYQLAPAGTAHEGVSTDTGGVLFAHGDLDLDIRAS